jgi:hypothetical protein
MSLEIYEPSPQAFGRHTTMLMAEGRVNFKLACCFASAASEFAVRHPESVLEEPNSRFNESELDGAITAWPGAWLKRVQMRKAKTDGLVAARVRGPVEIAFPARG